MAQDTDWGRYLDARWVDLVVGLEDDGVAPDDARLAAAETLLASCRGWARRVRDEQVDVTVWADARERAGLPARPGEPVPHGVRRLDVDDGPEEWLARAQVARATRRRRDVRRGVVATAVFALLAGGWAWWAARPEPYAVRAEDNPLPVAWYAAGDLHLAHVVVTIPQVRTFQARGEEVVAILGSGDGVLVRADGEVDPTDLSGDDLDPPPDATVDVPLGPYDVLLQSVRIPGGGTAHLIDSSRRAGDGDALRQSESGRRALVVCNASSLCSEPRTITGADGSIRLR